MKLKKWHREILNHRLESDGQVDCYADSFDLDYDKADEIVSESQQRLLELVETKTLTIEGLSQTDIWVLVDAVEGSVYVDASECELDHGGLSRAQFNAICEQYQELELFTDSI